MENRNQTTQNETMGNVIILNKPFLGGYLNGKGNIAHEIIDFLSTDDGNHYVYNLPNGVCPDDIWVDGTTNLIRSRREKYLCKYLVLTSEKHGNSFQILYVIELSEKLHRHHVLKSEEKYQRCRNDVIENIIRRRNIKYNGEFLNEIYNNEANLYLTFKARRIYKAENPISFELSEYNFQRNKGYLYDDRFNDDYIRLNTLIENNIANQNLQEFEPRAVNSNEIDNINIDKTFIDLIKQEDNEQVFTNILHSILKQGELFNHFCNRFRGDRIFNTNEEFEVHRETTIVKGRMDVCAESDNQRVIIENKINSGLNGVRPEENSTQLSTYYEWGTQKPTSPLCFVALPENRMSEIRREIEEEDPTMINVYQIIPYGEIAEFIKYEFDNNCIPETYAYYSLVPQIINAFKRHSLSKEDMYARMFLDATNN